MVCKILHLSAILTWKSLIQYSVENNFSVKNFSGIAARGGCQLRQQSLESNVAVMNPAWRMPHYTLNFEALQNGPTLSYSPSKSSIIDYFSCHISLIMDLSKKIMSRFTHPWESHLHSLFEAYFITLCRRSCE